MGILQWERSFSRRLFSYPTACQRDAGESASAFVNSLVADILSFASIVEFGTREEALRAISELNEQVLMGRPVYLREVS